MTLMGLEALLRGAGLSSAVTPAAFERLNAFLELRAKWARTHNLCGPQALAKPWMTDVVDCHGLLPVLDDTLRLVDVGSGSGTPGLIVACIQPERCITLVEPLTKRIAFLRTAVRALKLTQVTVVRSRWPIPLDEPVQVVSRAVVAPEIWPSLAAEGGPQVMGILRMLAALRPPCPLLDFTEVAALNYRTTSPRRVERWMRQ